MNAQCLDEPELQFRSGRHIDIRFGLTNYGPLDCGSATAPRKIKIGIIGSGQSIDELSEWLTQCRVGIDAKDSQRPNLFPRFPGFNDRCAFLSELVLDQSLNYELPQRDIDRVARLPLLDEAVVEAVRVFIDGIKHANEQHAADVVLCAPPNAMLNVLAGADASVDDAVAGVLDAADADAGAHGHGAVPGSVRAGPGSGLDFHDLLKARSMEIPSARPIQIVLPATYNSTKRRRHARRPGSDGPVQDEATRAWNLHTALYYKAGGTPWRLHEDTRKLSTCFIGVGFYYSLDRERILTSVAQVFNERGTGVVVRGGPASIHKDDRQAHLPEDGANALLRRALAVYKQEHRTLPARIVLHKTSLYNDAEREGFLRVIEELGVDSYELLSLRKSTTRLFRNAEYPPLRGSLLTLDSKTAVLYTRGSVSFYGTYPGMYMPRPLRIDCKIASSTPKYLAAEVLALTKMNWNNTQFDGSLPITIRAAQQVGKVLRYVADDQPVQARYGYYM